MRNRRPTIALGQMVLDTVIHNDQNRSRVNNQTNQTIGGPPSFAGIIGAILSKMYSWIYPPLIYAYTCPKAISLLKNYPKYQMNLNNLKIQPKCPQFRLEYPSDKKERMLSLKDPPVQFNPTDFNWEFKESPVVIIGSTFHEFNDIKLFSFLRKKCSYIAFDPQGCFRYLTSEGKIEFRNWWDSRILEIVDCLQISEIESKYLGLGILPIEVVKKILETPITSVILTRGRNGAILGYKSQKDICIFDVPAYTEGIIVDETGAGDIFLFCFITHLMAFQNELDAAAFATSVTSLFLEFRKTPEKILEDMIDLRQNIIRAQIIESSR
ncbi:MAG: hypothetical protein JSW11_06820 [Candidatus Heimdallarchaeota archaeon]|nr:MAG: hypothetical protein JSW11_06820 [Candidatus Heimdallarchaeota archaeon]